MSKQDYKSQFIKTFMISGFLLYLCELVFLVGVVSFALMLEDGGGEILSYVGKGLFNQKHDLGEFLTYFIKIASEILGGLVMKCWFLMTI